MVFAPSPRLPFPISVLYRVLPGRNGSERLGVSRLFLSIPPVNTNRRQGGKPFKPLCGDLAIRGSYVSTVRKEIMV